MSGSLTLVLISRVVLPHFLLPLRRLHGILCPLLLSRVDLSGVSQVGLVSQVYVRRCWFQLLIDMPFEVIRRDVTLEVVCLQK